ncbi:YceI family protein [Dyadobacter arcticus]|uniref:Polyisoprenoid-binding protein YceI n=1 Tax=Dyadobacter arcticus TaxID=1078754 RepID=A0ABX0URG7_9BACT|nr:YceI family protein [Dyadobacter arcticus]NIJ55552.1 polyisoprenoid-binding protein YceI [Dyadobacter arcticus]
MKLHLIRTVLVTVISIAMLSANALAQGSMFSTSTGNTRFLSVTPLENVDATNNKCQAILNTANSQLAIRMNMRDFDFPNKLMQEHFNENYIESAKYPTATFSGKIDKALDYTKDGQYDVSATGKFTVHGVTKDKTIAGKVKVEGGKITITSDFEVPLTDHKIDVPEVVFVKIAQVITVKAQYVLVPKK